MRRLVLVCALLGLPPSAFAQQAETIEYYQADVVGSIRIVYDVNGNVIDRQDYTPFGTAVLTGASMPNESFGGNEKDDETKQMYFYARSLTGRTGRFFSPDPVQAGDLDPQAWNRYTYALNNPLTFIDPYGLDVQCTTVRLTIAIRGNATNYYNGGSYRTCIDYGETSPEPIDTTTPTGPTGPPGGPGGPGTGGPGGTGGIGGTPTPQPKPKPKAQSGCDPVSLKGCGPNKVVVVLTEMDAFVDGFTTPSPCLTLFVNEAARGAFGPGPYGVSDTAQTASAVSRMNAALSYASQTTNTILKTPGLLYPFKSSVFRTMFTDALQVGSTTGSVLISLDIGIWTGLGAEFDAAFNGGCK